MKLTITAAAALIGLATVFGQASAAPATSLPDATPVIEVGGRDSGGHRSGHRRGGRDVGHRGGRRDFGHRGGRRDFGHRGGRRDFGRYGGGYGRHRGHNSHGHGHGHGDYRPYVFGGIALGTYLFLDAIDR